MDLDLEHILENSHITFERLSKKDTIRLLKQWHQTFPALTTDDYSEAGAAEAQYTQQTASDVYILSTMADVPSYQCSQVGSMPNLITVNKCQDGELYVTNSEFTWTMIFQNTCCVGGPLFFKTP